MKDSELLDLPTKEKDDLTDLLLRLLYSKSIKGRDKILKYVTALAPDAPHIALVGVNLAYNALNEKNKTLANINREKDLLKLSETNMKLLVVAAVYLNSDTSKNHLRELVEPLFSKVELECNDHNYQSFNHLLNAIKEGNIKINDKNFRSLIHAQKKHNLELNLFKDKKQLIPRQDLTKPQETLISSLEEKPSESLHYLFPSGTSQEIKYRFLENVTRISPIKPDRLILATEKAIKSFENKNLIKLSEMFDLEKDAIYYESYLTLALVIGSQVNLQVGEVNIDGESNLNIDDALLDLVEMNNDHGKSLIKEFIDSVVSINPEYMRITKESIKSLGIFPNEDGSKEEDMLNDVLEYLYPSNESKQEAFLKIAKNIVREEPLIPLISAALACQEASQNNIKKEGSEYELFLKTAMVLGSQRNLQINHKLANQKYITNNVKLFRMVGIEKSNDIQILVDVFLLNLRYEDLLIKNKSREVSPDSATESTTPRASFDSRLEGKEPQKRGIEIEEGVGRTGKRTRRSKI